MRGEKMYCGLKKRAGLLAAGAFLGLSLVQGLSVQAGTWKDSTFVQQITASGMEAENTDLLFASDNIASGIYNGCKWVIDKNGTLTVRAVSKDGKVCDLSGDVWYNYKNDIVKVDVDVPYSSHLSGMFAGCKNVTEIRVKIDKTSGSAAGMFMVGGSSFNGNLTKLDVSQLNTSGITSMRQMFKGCNALKELDLSNWDTSNVTDMSYMFDGCYRIESLDVSNFKTGKVTTMEHMFYGCGKAKTSSWVCDVSKFDTRNLVDMSGMFGWVRSVKG